MNEIKRVKCGISLMFISALICIHTQYTYPSHSSMLFIGWFVGWLVMVLAIALVVAKDKKNKVEGDLNEH